MEFAPSSSFVKLDSLDKNYGLISNFGRRSALQFVWDATLRSQNEYVQFEVMAQKKNESLINSEDNLVNYKTYKCGLCDINVPAVYRRAHNDSPNHKTMVKIADMVLERLRSDITMDTVDSDNINTTNSYFCEPCAAVVKKKDKNEHEISESHRKSVLYTKFLYNFHLILKDRDELDTVKMEYLKKDVETRKGIRDYFKNIVCEVIGEKFGGMEGVDITTSQEKEDVIKDLVQMEKPSMLETECEVSILNEVVDQDLEVAVAKAENGKEVSFIPDSQAKSVNIKDKEVIPCDKSIKDKKEAERMKISKAYFKALTNNMSLMYKFTFFGLDHVDIETSDKCKLRLSFNNFNGFSRKDDSKDVHCRICRVRIQGTMSEHIFEMIHIKKIRIPLEDKHCFRQIDAFFKHCALCNVIFNDNELHQKLTTHIDALKAALISTNNDDQAGVPPIQVGLVKADPKTKDQVYCNPCKRTIETHNYPAHAATKAHKSKLNGQSEPEMMYCKPCKRLIQTHNHTTHIAGNSHKKNVLAIEKEAESKSMSVQEQTVEENALISESAKQLADSLNSASRSESIAEVSNVKECNDSKSANDYEAMNEDEIRSATDHKQSNDTAVEENSLISKSAKQDIANSINFFLIGGSDSQKCYDSESISDIDCSDSETDFFNAMDTVEYNGDNSDSDNSSLSSDLPDMPVSVSTVGVAKTGNHVPDKQDSPNETSLQMATKANETYVTGNQSDCVTVTYLTLQTDDSSIKKVATNGETSKTYCVPCERYIDTHNYASHVASNVHRLSASTLPGENAQKTAKLGPGQKYCSPCNRVMDAHSYSTHVNGNPHKLNAAALGVETEVDLDVEHVKYQVEDVDCNSVRCRICKANVPNRPRNIKEHVNGNGHKKKYSQTLDIHDIVAYGSVLKCNLCKKLILIGKELDHMKLDTHKIHIVSNAPVYTFSTGVQPSYECPVCDITVLNNVEDRRKHEESAYHCISEASIMLNDIQRTLGHHHYKMSEDKSMLTCLICNTCVAYKDYKSHFKSATHVSNHENFLKQNKLQIVPDGYKCDYCGVVLKVNEELCHVSTPGHVSNMKAKQQSSVDCNRYICALCNVQVPFHPSCIEDHEAGLRHRQASVLCLVETERNGILHCTLCQVNVGRANSDEHVNGTRHKSNIKRFN